MSGALAGKRALVTGVANERSLAWQIAERFFREGAEIGLSYQGARQERRARRLAQGVAAAFVAPCDVSQDAEIAALFETVERHWPQFDILIHAIAFADAAALQGKLIAVEREAFRQALDISVYSLLALVRQAQSLLRGRRASVLTLSYHGARKVVPDYHLMGIAKAALEAAVRYLAAELGREGIRVNAVSAGPVKTLSAAVLPRFQDKLDLAAARAPLGELSDGADVAALAAFLCGPDALHMTGGTHYVDSGLHVLGA